MNEVRKWLEGIGLAKLPFDVYSSRWMIKRKAAHSLATGSSIS
jgi:hypothetical protein